MFKMQKLVTPVKVKVKFPPHAMKAYRRSEGIVPLILNRGTRKRCVVSITPCLVTPG
jgi:hypothetical protein